MKTKLITASILYFLLSLIIVSASLPPGRIIVAKVKGQAFAVDKATQTEKAIAPTMVLAEGQSVYTNEGAELLLLLSNGSTLSIGEESSLDIQEFKVAPHQLQGKELLNLEKEPSASITKINLVYGELTSQVKTLKPGSALNIISPVGTAGIRGTISSFRAFPSVKPRNGRIPANMPVSFFREQQVAKVVQAATTQAIASANQQGLTQAFVAAAVEISQKAAVVAAQSIANSIQAGQPVSVQAITQAINSAQRMANVTVSSVKVASDAGVTSITQITVQAYTAVTQNLGVQVSEASVQQASAQTASTVLLVSGAMSVQTQSGQTIALQPGNAVSVTVVTTFNEAGVTSGSPSVSVATTVMVNPQQIATINSAQAQVRETVQQLPPQTITDGPQTQLQAQPKVPEIVTPKIEEQINVNDLNKNQISPSGF